MKKFTKIIGATLAVGGVFFAGNVLAYQPNTGAGSTNQYGGSQNQNRIQQSYQRPPVQSYYRPAPPVHQPSIRAIPNPTGIPGMTPIVVAPPSNKPAPTAAQIGSRFIEKHPNMGGLVAATATTVHIVSGVANTTMAVGSVATTISQPYTAAATLPGAALRGGMALNNFRQACNAGAWIDYAKQVQKQQACIPYPGMK